MNRKKQTEDQDNSSVSAVPADAEDAGSGGPASAEPSTAAPAERVSGTSEQGPVTLEQACLELERLRQEVAEALDKYLRAKAEVENTRRRAEIDAANARKYGIERFAAELLAVRDSLELARTVDIQQENHTALEKMHEGLDLTLKLMDTAFQKVALKVIDPKGEKFDPEKHQAVSTVESDAIAPGYVAQVVQKGYTLHERLLRPAMVIVTKAADPGKTTEST
jgi:molecular chaperone GrpE